MIAHISDLHFGTVSSEVANGLLEDLNRFPVSLVAISGDLTQNAFHKEFEAAQEFLRKIESPVLVVPGNHDIPSWNLWERFTRPTARFRRWIEKESFPKYVDNEIAAIGFNSARSFGFYLDWSRGRVNTDQLRRVREFFNGHSLDKLRIVVSHHPLLRPEANPKARLVGRASKAIRSFSMVGVDIVLGGHLHKSYFGPIFSNEEQELRSPVIVVQASTSISSRTKNEPNAYNLIRYDDEKITVDTRAWSDAGNFETVRSSSYQRHAVGARVEKPASQGGVS